MLLANNTLHFGSVKSNNEMVVLCSSCHNRMILLCDSSQPCKPCNTAYILAASHWSPGVPKSVGIRAFTMWKGEKNFWGLGNLKKKTLSYIKTNLFLEIARGKVNPGKKNKNVLKGLECLKKLKLITRSCWFRDGSQGPHFLQVQWFWIWSLEVSLTTGDLFYASLLLERRLKMNESVKVVQAKENESCVSVATQLNSSLSILAFQITLLS